MSAPQLAEGWNTVLRPEFEKSYMVDLLVFLEREMAEGGINPLPTDVFRAFRETDLLDTKVVIIGQDPYPKSEDACGLAFSVRPGRPVPASLRSIFIEVHRDLGAGTILPVWPKVSGDLSHWTSQGVLLLNAILTTRAGISAAHRGKGWERFTITALSHLHRMKPGVVWMAWGLDARKLIEQVVGHEIRESMTENGNLYLVAPHPSPLARGFSGCAHFSRANEFLRHNERGEIDWFWKLNEPIDPNPVNSGGNIRVCLKGSR